MHSVRYFSLSSQPFKHEGQGSGIVRSVARHIAHTEKWFVFFRCKDITLPLQNSLSAGVYRFHLEKY